MTEIDHYNFGCNTCDFLGPNRPSENEAWGDGVAHENETGHQGGGVGVAYAEVTGYTYGCNSCDFMGPSRAEENDAWGDGVAHLNETGHEGGAVGAAYA